MAETWGYHLMLDCAGGSKIDDKDHMREFIKKLVVDIDMIAFGEPWIERFATHDPAKAGLSFCQMIETSNITGHFVESNGDFYIDIFSCKPYDIDVAMQLVRDYFSPTNIKSTFVNRQA